MKLGFIAAIFSLLLSGATIKSSKVSFHGEANPGFLSVDGEGGKLAGKPVVSDGKLSGTFQVKLNDLKTGMDLRDSHMREKFLETDKFPYAFLTLKPVIMSGKQKFSGTITIKGIVKPVSGDMKFDGRVVSATFDLKLSNFGIDAPSYKLVYLGDDINVKVVFVI